MIPRRLTIVPAWQPDQKMDCAPNKGVPVPAATIEALRDEVVRQQAELDRHQAAVNSLRERIEYRAALESVGHALERAVDRIASARGGSTLDAMRWLTDALDAITAKGATE